MFTAESALDGAGPYLRCILGVSSTVLRIVMDDWARAQDWDAKHGYMRAFDAKNGKLSIALCDGILVERVRLC